MLFIKSFPPPLGRGALPEVVDLHYLIVAFSLYALLSLPTGLVLWGAEGIVSWLSKKTGYSFLDLNRMDFFLLFGSGLLCFKWISNLLAYLVEREHLPLYPYLLLLPLLVLHVGIMGLFKRTARYYFGHWVGMVIGALFLSKTAYDIFIRSPLSVIAKGGLFVLFALGGLVLASVFFYLLKGVLSKRLIPPPAFVVFFVVLLAGGLFFTHHAWSSKWPFVFSAPHAVSPEERELRPVKNVIVVLVDCLRADYLGCYGYKKKTSPFLDSMAQSGIIFENCIAPSSWTIPSVVSLFTGVYVQQHGVNELGTVIPQELDMVQEVMQERGVETAAFVTNDFLKRECGYARGFNYYVDYYLKPEFKEYVTSGLFFLGALLFFKNELLCPFSVDPGGTRWWSIGFPPFNHERISAGRVTDDLLQWIHIHRERPFYVYLHYMDVHCPYDTTWYPLFDREAYGAQDEGEKLRNIYEGRVAYVDQQLRRIWEALVQLHIAEKTLVIVTADHGEELYDHGGTGHCTTLYEELIRVPLVMVHPFLSEKGRRIHTQVSLIDIPATVLDFFDVPIPGQMVGRSLITLIQDRDLDPEEPTCALSYTTRGRKSLKTEEGRTLWNKKVWDQGIILESLRVDNEWKLIVGSDGRVELYNVKEDPRETNDVGEGIPLMVPTLRERLAEELARLPRYGTTREGIELSPDTSNKLRALGYL